MNAREVNSPSLPKCYDDEEVEGSSVRLTFRSAEDKQSMSTLYQLSNDVLISQFVGDHGFRASR